MRERRWLAAAVLSFVLQNAGATEIPHPLARVDEAQDARFRPDTGTTPVFSLPESITKANQQWRNMFAGALLDRGEIKTGGQGKVTLGLANGNKLRIGPASELRLELLRHDQQSGATELELRKGEIECQPTTQKVTARALVLRTQVLLVQADHARFSVRHTAEKEMTIVSAAAGSVRIERRDGSASMTLSEGQQISVRKSDKGVPTPENN